MPRAAMMEWDREEAFSHNVVWWTRLDKRFQVEVQRVSPYLGMLCIFDHDNHDELLHEEEVTLSYQALFGPDLADVNHWKEKVIAFVDQL